MATSAKCGHAAEVLQACSYWVFSPGMDRGSFWSPPLVPSLQAPQSLPLLHHESKGNKSSWQLRGKERLSLMRIYGSSTKPLLKNHLLQNIKKKTPVRYMAGGQCWHRGGCQQEQMLWRIEMWRTAVSKGNVCAPFRWRQV